MSTTLNYFRWYWNSVDRQDSLTTTATHRCNLNRLCTSIKLNYLVYVRKKSSTNFLQFKIIKAIQAWNCMPQSLTRWSWCSCKCSMGGTAILTGSGTRSEQLHILNNCCCTKWCIRHLLYDTSNWCHGIQNFFTHTSTSGFTRSVTQSQGNLQFKRNIIHSTSLTMIKLTCRIPK